MTMQGQPVPENARICRDASDLGWRLSAGLLRKPLWAGTLAGASSPELRGHGAEACPLRHGELRVSLYDRADHGVRSEEET